MHIFNVIFWSTVYSFFTYHTAKLLGYEGETLHMIAITGLVLGAIRGLHP
jgi:hypothetical protein